jgi:hypothetical protein
MNAPKPFLVDVETEKGLALMPNPFLNTCLLVIKFSVY